MFVKVWIIRRHLGSSNQVTACVDQWEVKQFNPLLLSDLRFDFKLPGLRFLVRHFNQSGIVGQLGDLCKWSYFISFNPYVGFRIGALQAPWRGWGLGEQQTWRRAVLAPRFLVITTTEWHHTTTHHFHHWPQPSPTTALSHHTSPPHLPTKPPHPEVPHSNLGILFVMLIEL